MAPLDDAAVYDDLLDLLAETAELDAYARFEHVVRLLKARVLQKLGV